jgi:hypothetical protein
LGDEFRRVGNRQNVSAASEIDGTVENRGAGGRQRIGSAAKAQLPCRDRIAG